MSTTINNEEPGDHAGHPEDTDMSGSPPSSPSSTEPTPEPKSPRLNIASLCNPMDEAPDIRQLQASSQFDNEDVQKPASLKNYSCEHYFFFFTEPIF